jgi:hypothetical protein
MTDTLWRLSGGIGDVDSENGLEPQKMTQGLGFPLRPVSGVPPSGTGGSLNDESVASGAFMQFLPEGWEAGKFHLAGATVTDGEWTMVANKATLDSPYPVPADNAEFGHASWTPATQSDSSVIYSGQVYTFNESCILRQLNAWVPQLTVDTAYRVVLISVSPNGDVSTAVYDDPVLVVAGWATIALSNQIVPAGTVITAYVDALNSGSDQEVSGGWNFTGQDNIAGPVAQAWNHNNANSIVRISKTDLDGTDRTAELAGITVNSALQFADTSNVGAFNAYRVTSEPPVDLGTYFEYAVVLQEQGEGGVPIGVTTLTATIPIPLPTEYSEAAGLVPVYTGPDVTAVGFLQFGGVDQGGAANGYGIDLEVETVNASPDWTVFAYNTP